MAKKLVDVTAGEIYAIPLFVSEKSPRTRFYKRDFVGARRSFAFGRVISDEQGGGLIIEVFECVGSVETEIDEIVGAGRLFRPIATTSLAIYKKRWPLIGLQADYDRERDSGYSAIELLLSPFDNPVLWRGGVKSDISIDEVGAYEPWTWHAAHKIELRIIQALRDRGIAWE